MDGQATEADFTGPKKKLYARGRKTIIAMTHGHSSVSFIGHDAVQKQRRNECRDELIH